MPERTIPLLASATLLPIQPRPDKIRPIAISTAIRRLVTKALLPQALECSREYLALLQIANGVSCGLDSVVHDVRFVTNSNRRDRDFALISLHVHNTFNRFSRQRMLDVLPKHAHL